MKYSKDDQPLPLVLVIDEADELINGPRPVVDQATRDRVAELVRMSRESSTRHSA